MLRINARIGVDLHVGVVFVGKLEQSIVWVQHVVGQVEEELPVRGLQVRTLRGGGYSHI